MTKLEAKARELAKDFSFSSYEQGLLTNGIAQLAREFAADALRASLAESLPNPDASGKVEAMRAQIIAAAIKAAEGGV